MSASCDRSCGQQAMSSRRAHRYAQGARHSDHLTELGSEVIAHRLRTLGHPVRVRLMRALDRREAGVEQLADELGVSAAAVAAHLRVLGRAGVTFRTDSPGPACYCLADWPSLWLVDQLARRIRSHALVDSDAEESDRSDSR